MSQQALGRMQILMEQGRYTEAEEILQNLLKEYPDDPLILANLAEVKLRLGQYDAATVFVEAALAMHPDSGYLFYIKARIALQKDKYDEAEELLQQAIQCDPEDPGFYAVLASVKLTRKQYQQALELSDQALELDAEHILALNNRSRALLKLNRKEDSYKTIEGALREDPNNAYTHANYGWNLLEKGEHKKSLEHFRESLRINPGMDVARSGMVEALKASNPLYRMFLRYSFWMSNLTKKYQWGFIIGIYAVSRVLGNIASRNEELQPYLMPVIILIALFAFSTWVMAPVSNLFFRLSKYGKYLLEKKEIISSNFVGLSLLSAVLGGIGFIVTGDERWMPLVVLGFTMMMPFGVMFSPAKYKNILIYYAGAMALIGAIAVLTGFWTNDIFNIYAMIYLAGFFIFQWGSNFIMIREANA